MELKTQAAELGILAVIPTYNNCTTIAAVVTQVLEYCRNVVVVNDGSTDQTAGILTTLGVPVISYQKNRGKGYALRKALDYALENGYQYMLTIDADGQHYASDIEQFIQAIKETPHNFLVGARNLAADNMPGKNTFGNKFSNFWFLVETGQKMEDTQSGYRLYPITRLQGMRLFTPRYEFEIEILVRAAWRGIPVRNIPINVFYAKKEERISHFKPFRDFTRISLLNSILVLIALFYYYPWKFLRALTKENIRKAISKNITHSPESNLKIALAIGLGIFFGIIPLWGYQMIAAGITAHLLKLNKVLTIISSNISIPPMIPFILYGSFYTGGKLSGRGTALNLGDISLEKVSADLFQYITGSIAFAIICGISAIVISYIIMLICKRKPAYE